MTDPSTVKVVDSQPMGTISIRHEIDHWPLALVHYRVQDKAAVVIRASSPINKLRGNNQTCVFRLGTYSCRTIYKSVTSPELVILGITLCGPELVSVPIGAVELCGVPTAPGTVSAAAAGGELVYFKRLAFSLGC